MSYPARAEGLVNMITESESVGEIFMWNCNCVLLTMTSTITMFNSTQNIIAIQIEEMLYRSKGNMHSEIELIVY